MKRVFLVCLMLVGLYSYNANAELYVGKNFPSETQMAKAVYGIYQTPMGIKVIGKTKIKADDYYLVFGQIRIKSPLDLANPETAVGGTETVTFKVYKTDDNHWIIDNHPVSK